MAKPTRAKPFSAMRDNWPTDEIAAKQWLEERIARMKTEGVFAEVITLTPALAAEFKRRNADNRPLRPAKLKQVEDEVANDNFMLNGETIIFADTGQMNDGQHRCEAVINRMKSIETVIVFGVSRESRKTVDNGAARSPSDHLAVEGIKYATESASIGRFVLAWEKEKGRNLTQMNRVAPTPIVDRVLDDVAIGEAAAFGRTHYTKTPIAAPSILGFCYYAFAKVDKPAAEDFLKKVIYGEMLAPDTAAYQTREMLLALDRRVREQRVELLFAGFVAHRAGTPLGKYRIRHELAALTPVAPAFAKRAAKGRKAPEMVAGGQLEMPGVKTAGGKVEAPKGRQRRREAVPA